MTSTGIVGAGPLLADLVRYAAPLEGVHLAECWPADAVVLGAKPVADWRQIAASAELQALIVLPGAHALDAAEAGLAAGKTVLCPAPCATDAAGLARLVAAGRRGGGVLLSGGELSACDTARHARAVLDTGSLGAVHSLYLAIRTPMAATASVLDQSGWEAFRFVVDCLPGRLLHVFATGNALFGRGPAPDTVVVLARFEPDVVVTIELSHCLPAAIPASRHGEVQFEVVGAAEVLRADPFAATVRHATAEGWTAQPWGDDPIVAMLAELPQAGRIPAGRDIAAHGRVLAMMDAVRRSLAQAAVAIPVP